jgi:hypothetical protein
MPIGAGKVTYSTSASEIATVSSRGVVTAAGSGRAVITAELTLGSITRTASMNATVHAVPAGFPEIAGVYDVSALITQSGWGVAGTRATAVMTIQQSGDTRLFAGTFEEFRFFDPGNDESMEGPLSGSVSGSFDCAGRVEFELRMAGLQSALWYAEGTLGSAQITGHFWDPGSNYGSFTAARRAPE